MTAAMVVGAPPEPNLDLQELRRDMGQLRLTLMGLKSDIDEATGPVRSASLNEDLRRGVRSALHLVDGVRLRLGT
jgi:hypothetical protein